MPEATIQMKTTYRSGKVEYTAFSERNAKTRVRAAIHLGQIHQIDKVEVSGDEDAPTYKVVDNIWTKSTGTPAAPAVDVEAIKAEAVKAAQDEFNAKAEAAQAELDKAAAEKDAAVKAAETAAAEKAELEKKLKAAEAALAKAEKAK